MRTLKGLLAAAVHRRRLPRLAAAGGDDPSAGTSVMTRSSPSVCPSGDLDGSVRAGSSYQMPEKSILPSRGRRAGAFRVRVCRLSCAGCSGA